MGVDTRTGYAPRARAALVAAGIVATTALAVLSPPAGAAEADGCTGSATSFDADGTQLDTVRAPGDGGTSGDPFEVDPEGTVEWEAQASPAIPDSGSWSVGTQSTPQLSWGGDGGLSEDSGTEDMSEHLVVDLPILGETRVAAGTFAVEITVEGDGATCTFSGYVKIGGSALGTPVFWAGLLLGALGVLMALLATPTATASSAAAGGAAGSAPTGGSASGASSPPSSGAGATTPLGGE